ncbi:MAG TPA: hypothetical protein VJJ22_04835 [Candidatus Paceibacterota bacterium]
MKKGVIALTVLGVLIIVILTFSKLNKIEPIAKNSPTPVAIANLDSDSDNLADWEEALWGSDPNKPDTDLDGTNDGEEVRTKRNPLIPGPSDAIQAEVVASQEPESTPYVYEFDNKVGESLTDKLAINLTTNYLTAKSSGVYDANTGNQIINSLVSEAGSPEIYRTITLEDLNIGGSVNAVGAEEYGLRLNSALSKFDSMAIDEPRIISNAIKNDNLSILDGLTVYATKYKTLRATLLNMNTPKQFANLHLEFTQAVDTVARSLGDIQKFKEDAVTLLREVARYRLAMQSLYNTYMSDIAQINKYQNS